MPIMYRCPGDKRHVTRGFLYDQRDHADADKAHADGWFDTLEEAAGLAPVAVNPMIEAIEALKMESVEDLQEWARQKAIDVGLISDAKEPEDNAPPTRDEMLMMAEKYGIDVDKRWGDKRLAAELDKAKAQ